MEEKDFNSDELSNIEVTLSPETVEKIDQLDAISLDNLSMSKENSTVNKSIDESLSEITVLQKEQNSQNESLLKAVDNLSNIASQQKDDNDQEPIDPVLKSLDELRVDTNTNNENLLKELKNNRPIEVAEKEDMSPILIEKFDDLSENLKALNQETINNNNTINTDNSKAVTEIVNQSETNNSNLLNQIEISNKNAVTEIKNLQETNNQTLQQSNVTNESIKNILQETQESNVNTQNNLTLQNENVQSILETISVQNVNNKEQSDAFLNTLNEIQTSNASQLNVINEETKNIVTSQNEILTANRDFTIQNNTNTPSQKLVEKLDNITVVQKENQEIEKSEAAQQLDKANQTLNDLKEKSESLKTSVAQSATPAVVATPAAKPADNKDLIDMLSYSVQIQSGMLELLQQLVDGQNMRRYTEPPIKN